jgi:hypothetical protein
LKPVTQGDGHPTPRKAAEEMKTMPSGGHARSGPPPDPNSLKSAKLGLTFTTLPAEGYAGEAPDFPLPDCTYNEKSLWLWAWKQPQAAAWAKEAWRWPNVAMWVRTFVRCSAENAKTADVNSLHRLADEIGMTTPGLKMNGWRIAADQLAEKRAEKTTPAAPTARDRMKAVRSAAAGQ